MPTTGAFSLIEPVEPKNPGIAVGKDPTVRSNEPITVTVVSWRHANNWLIERFTAHRAVKLRHRQKRKRHRQTQLANNRHR